MLKDKKYIRDMLPESVVNYFDDITIPRVLGATKHIKLIYDIILGYISQNSEFDECVTTIKEICSFFKETRGKSSHAIVNALNDLETQIDEIVLLKRQEDLSTLVIKNKEEMAENAKKCAIYASNLAENYRKIMVFDYSSTVDTFIEILSKEVEVVVPESRSINGGVPFLKNAAKHQRCKFILDAAICDELKDCDAVFIGAETFYVNGDAFNTIGSDMVAVLTDYFHIPYYVITPILKVDTLSLFAKGKKVITKDLRHKIGTSIEEEIADKVDFSGRECVRIDKYLINSYITEYGIFTPDNLYPLILEKKPVYLKEV